MIEKVGHQAALDREFGARRSRVLSSWMEVGVDRFVHACGIGNCLRQAWL